MATKIVLVTGEAGPKLDAAFAAWWAEDSNERRIIRTRADLHRALDNNKVAGIKTPTEVFDRRKSRLLEDFTSDQVEVIAVA